MVGEIRGAEAADLLQALNTGHGGSLTTIHANNATSALDRLASCVMQARNLPWDAICRNIVNGISLVLHMSRIEGRRAVEEARYLTGWRSDDNTWIISPAGLPETHADPSRRAMFHSRAQVFTHHSLVAIRIRSKAGSHSDAQRR